MRGNPGRILLFGRRVPFDQAAGFGINDFRPFACLCGGSGRPSSFGKLVRSYQSPAVYPNLKGAVCVVTAGVFFECVVLHNWLAIPRIRLVPGRRLMNQLVPANAPNAAGARGCRRRARRDALLRILPNTRTPYTGGPITDWRRNS